MSDKTARKFAKLLAAYKEARDARKAASGATREVKALNGEVLTMTALASRAGAKAVESELAALRDERRALKRVAAYATRHADAAKAAKSTATSPADTTENKSTKARKAEKSAKPAPRSKKTGKSADVPVATKKGKVQDRPAGQE